MSIILQTASGKMAGGLRSGCTANSIGAQYKMGIGSMLSLIGITVRHGVKDSKGRECGSYG